MTRETAIDGLWDTHYILQFVNEILDNFIILIKRKLVFLSSNENEIEIWISKFIKTKFHVIYYQLLY